MSVRVAASAGFCFGVDRAVGLVEQTVREGKRAVTLGPIIHNHHVVQHFAALGVREIASPEEVPGGSAVIIRSHGVSRAVYEALQARGLEIIDATCPFVSRIHRIVQEAEANGRQPLIIGTPEHPEVVAIAGWCRHPLVFPDGEALQKWLDDDPKRHDLPFTMVSQTTSTQFLWDSCKKIAKKVCTNCEIFDTICKATENRQTEAAELASQSDAMVVVGDKNSSNTQKLYEICKKNCQNTYYIETINDLVLNNYGINDRIGITAGASTPPAIIKEVITTMSEMDEVKNTMEGEELTFEQSLRCREFEPDGPNYTPRISGVMHIEGGQYDYAMSILKSNNGDPSACNRYTFSYENPANGEGHFIHTYMHDDNPLPSFEGEPKLVGISGDIDTFANMVWESLNEDNKVSLFVRYIDIATGKYETRIINKNK